MRGEEEGCCEKYVKLKCVRKGERRGGRNAKQLASAASAEALID